MAELLAFKARLALLKTSVGVPFFGRARLPPSHELWLGGSLALPKIGVPGKISTEQARLQTLPRTVREADVDARAMKLMEVLRSVTLVFSRNANGPR